MKLTEQEQQEIIRSLLSEDKNVSFQELVAGFLVYHN